MSQLPEGWKIKMLDELCEISRGGSPRPIKQFLTDASDGVNWIKISDATASSKYISKTKEKIKTEGIKRSRLVKEGDFLLSNSMSFGRPYIMKTSGCIHDGWLVLRDKSGQFDQDFLYHFLGSAAAYKQFDNLAAGSTVRNLNIGLVKRVQVLLPPLPEQKRIVSILDAVFAGISKAVANAAKNLANARELFESYLNNIFTKKGEGWLDKRLDDVCVKIQDGAHHSPKQTYPEKTSERFLYITSKNIRNNYMDLSKIQYVGLDFHDTIYPRCNPEIGDVLLTKDGANTGNVTLNTIKEPFSLLSSVCLIKTDQEQLSPGFLKYYIQSKHGFEQITGKMTGAAIKRIILKTIKAATIPLPSLIVQDSFVKYCNFFYEKTQRLETIYQQKLTALAELKQSVLQKAFAGELTADAIRRQVKI